MMKNKAYILQPDIKAYFPNWDKMTKEEQQKWENEFEAMKKKSKPAIWNPDKAAEGVFCPTCKKWIDDYNGQPEQCPWCAQKLSGWIDGRQHQPALNKIR